MVPVLISYLITVRHLQFTHAVRERWVPPALALALPPAAWEELDPAAPPPPPPALSTPPPPPLSWPFCPSPAGILAWTLLVYSSRSCSRASRSRPSACLSGCCHCGGQRGGLKSETFSTCGGILLRFCISATTHFTRILGQSRFNALPGKLTVFDRLHQGYKYGWICSCITCSGAPSYSASKQTQSFE